MDVPHFISLSGDIPCCPLKQFKAHKNQVCIFSELHLTGKLLSAKCKVLNIPSFVTIGYSLCYT